MRWRAARRLCLEGSDLAWPRKSFCVFVAGFWLAGNEGMGKKMATTIRLRVRA